MCRCEVVPSQCDTVLAYTHYAPGIGLIISNSLSDLNEEISMIKQMTEYAMCGELLILLSCIITFPACSASIERLIPICESQCLIIADQITQCRMNISKENFPTAFILFDDFNCENPMTYYNFPEQYIETNPDNCLMISKL